ncbi:MAG: hypothetical protein IJX52_07585 [Oscillibacter sp.]|nr:hypothetical protein [Oscillibacter sp.]
MDDMNKLSQELQKNPAMLRSLMQSADGQTLMRLLTQKDQGAGLQQAVQSAMKGDTAKMADMVRQIMQSPDGAALVERINQATKQ